MLTVTLRPALAGGPSQGSAGASWSSGGSAGGGSSGASGAGKEVGLSEWVVRQLELLAQQGLSGGFKKVGGWVGGWVGVAGWLRQPALWAAMGSCKGSLECNVLGEAVLRTRSLRQEFSSHSAAAAHAALRPTITCFCDLALAPAPGAPATHFAGLPARAAGGADEHDAKQRGGV